MNVLSKTKANTNEAQQIENIWKALAKYGINSEEELKVAVKNMKKINIGCMVYTRNEHETVM